jgi:hypothetical protein
MNPNFYAILALDIANERLRDAERLNRFRSFDHGPNVVRRSMARAAAALSRSSASVANRLDGEAMVRGRSSVA